MRKNLGEFLAFYNGHGEHPVTDITVPKASGRGDSPFIILRHGPYTMIVNPLAFDSHLSVDCYSFVDGEAATAATFGMTAGCQFDLPNTGTTSHGQPSAGLIAVLLGEQASGNQ